MWVTVKYSHAMINMLTKEFDFEIANSCYKK